jgi:SM-20-related protein
VRISERQPHGAAAIQTLTERGVYVEADFLDAATCSDVRSAMHAAAAGKAFIVEGHRYVVDEKARRATLTSVDEATARVVTDRLNALRPRLEATFGVSLAPHCAGPEFLIYREGDFFHPHKDTLRRRDLPLEVQQRALSAVVFLNGYSETERSGHYAGGALRFFHPQADATWENCRVPFYGEPGMLVIFRSDTVHEVTPILHGQRYTAVTWYYPAAPHQRTQSP